MRRAQQQTISFPCYDSSVQTGATKTGLSFSTGDIKVSKDGGAFANASNLPSELGTTGRYALTLTAAELNCSWVHVSVEKTGMRPQDVVGATSEQPSGAVVADGGNSATTFVTNLAESVTDHWKDAVCCFTSGSLAGQLKRVTGYNGTTKALSFSTGFTAAPATGALFILLNI